MLRYYTLFTFKKVFHTSLFLEMASFCLIQIVVLTFALLLCVRGGDEKSKLQIGIKKRVAADKCLEKSKNGDELHMHYTVNANIKIFLKFMKSF